MRIDQVREAVHQVTVGDMAKAAKPNLSDEDWTSKFFEASTLFSPSAPINEHDLFAGRSRQIKKVVEAVMERGKHAVLFGERGVGKTSLAGVFTGLFPSTLQYFKLIREQVDPSDDFSSIWRKVFRDIHVSQSHIDGTSVVPLSEFYPNSIFPDDVRRELVNLFRPSDMPVIVIDEFDKAKNKEVHTLMANTIKSLSDYSVNATVVLVGVADDLNDLIGEHESITRCIEQILMPRMHNTEMREILDKRVPKLGMRMHADAYYKIIELSRGLPSYVHLLGLYSVQSAINRKSLEVLEEDVDSAIQSALERSQESIQEAYAKATHSNRSDNLYRHVLLACALATPDDRGQFTPTSVCDPLSDILKKQVKIDAFQQHLKKFITEERSSILLRRGQDRAYKFRFRDPMMQPYVIMKGIEDGLVGKTAMKALSFPEQPELNL